MDLIIQIMILIAIYITVGMVSRRIAGQTDEKYKGNVRLSKTFLYVGYGLSIFCALFGIVMYFVFDELMLIVSMILSVLSLVLVLGFYGFRIQYDEKKIQFRRFFGKYKVLYFKEICAIEFGLDLYIRTEIDTLIVPRYTVNLNEFYGFLMNHVELKSETSITPRVRRFKDAVYRPGEIIFVFILFIAVDITAILIIVSEWVQGRIEITDPIVLGVLICFSIVPTLLTFFAVFSVKRAHSSKTMRRIACLFIKESYIRK